MNGQPQWSRSKGQDTLSFVIKSNWPVSIQSLVIKDDSNTETRGNVVTAPYNDPVDATAHSVAVKTFGPLTGGRAYKYEVTLTASGLTVTPSQPLNQINLPPAPTKDFDLVQFPSTPDQLTIKDPTKDFTFKAQTNDSGKLDIVFHVQKIGGSNTVHSADSADGLTHTFTIPQNEIPSDGQYSFRYVGTREVQPSTLADQHASVLIVSTKTDLAGPIGLGLTSDNTKILVTYCLSQQRANEVRIFQDPNPSFAGAQGQPSGSGGGCDKGGSPYTATISLAEFSAKLPAAAAKAAAPANTVGASTPAAVPIQLRILDVSATPRPLQSLTLAAVLLPNQDPTDLIKQVTNLASKDTSTQDKAAATQALTSKYNLPPETIKALTDLGKKSNAGSTIGKALANIGKSLLTAYLGIPATPAAK